MKSLKKHLFLPFIVSAAIGILVCGASALLCSALMSALRLPVEWGEGFGLFSLSTGSLFSGYVLGRKKKRAGIKQGFLCGTALFLTALILSLLFGEISFISAAKKLVLCTVCAIFGAIAGVNKEHI